MVLMNMKLFLKICFFIVLVFCFSCEDKGWFTNCSDCTASEPVETNLLVKLEKDQPEIIINVFEGELEDSILYASRTVSFQVDNSFWVKINEKYTVTASYNIDGKIYTAIDSATPKVKYTETQCEDACYYVYDKVVNLRLKYTAD
jgi:hypothetical protein